jgi:hypothetical protein
MDDDLDSIASSSFLKDRHVIQTLLKISDTMDKNSFKASEDREKKDPGFQKLDYHRELHILNASVPEPFDDKATSPPPYTVISLQKRLNLRRERCFYTVSTRKIFFSSFQLPLPVIYTMSIGCGLPLPSLQAIVSSSVLNQHPRPSPWIQTEV